MREQAELVTTHEAWRRRLVHLNPVPIVDLAQRWLDVYSAFAWLALTRLRGHIQCERPSQGRTAPGVPPENTTDCTTRAYIRADTDATRPAWWSRHHWLHAVALAVAKPDARTLWQSKWRIGRHRLWATLKAIASFADHAAGL